MSRYNNSQIDDGVWLKKIEDNLNFLDKTVVRSFSKQDLKKIDSSVEFFLEENKKILSTNDKKGCQNLYDLLCRTIGFSFYGAAYKIWRDSPLAVKYDFLSRFVTEGKSESVERFFLAIKHKSVKDLLAESLPLIKSGIPNELFYYLALADNSDLDKELAMLQRRDRVIGMSGIFDIDNMLKNCVGLRPEYICDFGKIKQYYSIADYLFENDYPEFKIQRFLKRVKEKELLSKSLNIDKWLENKKDNASMDVD